MAIEDILRDINEDRLVSGFPEVRGEQVEAELAGRKRQMRDAVKDALNQVTTITYSSGLVQTVTDPRGFTATFQYDAARRVDRRATRP